MGTIFTPTAKKAEFALKLRTAQTYTEIALGKYLLAQNIGTVNRPVCPWKEQVVVKGWIVDFYNHHRLLAIEVDGGIHDTPEQRRRDALKDKILHEKGISVIRIKNKTVAKHAELIGRFLDRAFSTRQSKALIAALEI